MKSELNAYIEARRKREELKKDHSLAVKNEEEAEAALIEAMVQDETQSIKLDDGTTFYLARRPRFKLNQANNDLVREWLREQVGDDYEFVEVKVERKRLNEYLKTILEENQEADLPDFLEFTTDPEIAVRGWSGHIKNEEP